ncbi:MAG: thioesterase [Kiritimatiellae bacterium]|nr:thioesterase [Kiritimatiellia bacterium]
MQIKPILEQDKIMTVPFTVRSYESDASRRATIQTLCNYFQEMAWLHAAHLGFALADQEDCTKIWMLLQIQVRMRRYPLWGDTVHVSTWPSGKNRLYAYRDFEVRDDQGECLATATSSWIIIDLKRRRPQRIPDTLDLCIPREKPRAAPPAPAEARIKMPESPDAQAEFQVRLSDIDVNNHVNNVNFIEWAIEAAPASWRNTRQLTELDVFFKAESNYGERIVSQFAIVQPLESALHCVCRPADSKILMLARTTWKPIP